MIYVIEYNVLIGAPFKYVTKALTNLWVVIIFQAKQRLVPLLHGLEVLNVSGT